MCNKLTSLIVLCVFFLTSCNTTVSKEEKAKDLIENLIKKDIDDPSTYEAVEYGTLDSVSLIEIDPFFLSLREKARDQGRSSYKEQIDQAYLSLDISKALGLNLDTTKSGHKIFHKFRAQNKLGLLSLNTYVFYLDSDLTQVLYTEELE